MDHALASSATKSCASPAAPPEMAAAASAHSASLRAGGSSSSMLLSSSSCGSRASRPSQHQSMHSACRHMGLRFEQCVAAAGRQAELAAISRWP